MPLALQNFKCFIAVPTREIGGHNQFKSRLQSLVNAFTPSEWGQWNLELNLWSLAFFSSANLSIVQCPNVAWVYWKVTSSIDQSSVSVHFERESAKVFSSLGTQVGWIDMLFRTHSSNIFKAICCKSCLVLPTSIIRHTLLLSQCYCTSSLRRILLKLWMV